MAGKLLLSLQLKFLICSFFLPYFALAWPPSLRQTFQLELLHNSALKEDDLRLMAYGIHIATNKPDTEEAYKRFQEMPYSEVKKILSQDFVAKCYEIPLEEFTKHFQVESRILKGRPNRQIFDRNGVKYIRWFVHPFNSSNASSSFDKKFGAYLVDKKYRGIISSSRSIAILDITTKEVWGMKVSLPNGFGPFKSKAYDSTHAAFHFQMSTIIDNDPFLKSRFFIEESYLSAIGEGLNEGQQVRDLSISKSGGITISLSALFDPEIRIDFAKKNGYGEDWKRFFNEVIMPDLGTTLGYLYETYGLAHNSLHSQNITVKFGKQGKFIGVKLRDFDFNVQIDKYSDKLGRIAADSFIRRENIYAKDMVIDFAPALFLGMADEIPLTLYLGQSFSLAFLKEVARLRNLNLDEGILKDRVRNTLGISTEPNRPAIDLTVSMTEEILDFSIAIKSSKPLLVSKEGVNGSSKTVDVQDIKKLIVGASTPYEFNVIDQTKLFQAKTQLVDELTADPGNSPLKEVLSGGNSLLIRRMVSIFAQGPNETADQFFAYLMEKHSDILAREDLSFFFFSRQNENLFKQFLQKASQESLKNIWKSRKINFLLTYSEWTFNRFLNRCNPELAKSIVQEMDDSMKLGNLEFKNHFKSSFKIIQRLTQQKTIAVKCSELF